MRQSLMRCGPCGEEYESKEKYWSSVYGEGEAEAVL